MFDIKKVSGIGDFTEKTEKERKIFACLSTNEAESKAFLIVNTHPNGETKTIEVRTDKNLASTLQEKYESVMRSRYFGRGGIEIVTSGQLKEDEIYDLVRLSYNLTRSA